MKLLFKQRVFSWFDSYDIYDEAGCTIYTVEGQLSWGHCMKVFDKNKKELGMLKQIVLSFLPKFEIYISENYVGCIKKEFTLFKPVFDIDYNGWYVKGDFMEWDYQIMDSVGNHIATVEKELFKLTDTYVIDVKNPSDALAVLMLVLAIDAEKCSRD